MVRNLFTVDDLLDAIKAGIEEFRANPGLFETDYYAKEDPDKSALELVGYYRRLLAERDES